MADVDVLIEANDQASAAIKAVNSSLDDTSTQSKKASMSFADMAGAINVVEKALGYAKQAFDATVGATVAYADEVRALMQVTGASAEETSKLIQVLDDYKVSSTDAMNAQRFLTKQGIVLTTDALADLSAQYVGLTDQTDKNAFAQKNLGRNYKAFIEVLQQGPDAIRAASDAVSENLVLTQKSVDQAREYQFALDNWNDSVLALQVSIGTKLLPVMSNMLNSTDDTRRAVEILTETNDRAAIAALLYGGAMNDNARAALEKARAEREAASATKETVGTMEDAEDAALAEAEAQKELAKALQATTSANNDMLSLIGKIKNETDNYNASLDEMTAKYGRGSAEVKKLADAHEKAMKKIAYELFLAKLQADGFTDVEYEMAIAAGVAAGVIDVEAARMAEALEKSADEASRLVGGLNRAGNVARAISGDYILNIRTIFSNYGKVPSGLPDERQAPRPGPKPGPKPMASGGMFVIPPKYGNEGFPMGSDFTASAGERVTVTPPGAGAGGPMIDYDEFARVLVSALQRAGVR